MDKKNHSRSNNYLKKPDSGRNHITGGDMQKQYQGAESSEGTRQG